MLVRVLHPGTPLPHRGGGGGEGGGEQAPGTPQPRRTWNAASGKAALDEV